jgi:predicted phosphodiesterase
MRIAIHSDLHNEFYRSTIPPLASDADVVVLAGDIDAGSSGIHWAARCFSQPVVAILGNHEAYNRHLSETIDDCRAAAHATPNVQFLEQNCAIIDGVRFLGCALWSDFDLWGIEHADNAMQAAEKHMNDFQIIHVGPTTTYNSRPLKPSDTRAIHLASRAWLERELAKPHDGPTVVVTHNLPSLRSVAPKYLTTDEDRMLNAAFASNLDPLIENYQPDLWVHGHTHDSCDYQIGTTQIVCNPRGYRHEPNQNYKTDFEVEL